MGCLSVGSIRLVLEGSQMKCAEVACLCRSSPSRRREKKSGCPAQNTIRGSTNLKVEQVCRSQDHPVRSPLEAAKVAARDLVQTCFKDNKCWIICNCRKGKEGERRYRTRRNGSISKHYKGEINRCAVLRRSDTKIRRLQCEVIALTLQSR